MILLLKEVDFRQTKANARNVLKSFRRLERIAREVGYSERSIQRMKSEALIEFAEAYRNGKLIAYK